MIEERDSMREPEPYKPRRSPRLRWRCAMCEPPLHVRAFTQTKTMGKRSLGVLRGASYAGKSMLHHPVGGLDLPNAGEILFEGNDLISVSERKLTEFRNRRLGFIFLVNGRIQS